MKDGGGGKPENDNNVEHITNGNGDDADDEIDGEKLSNKNEKRVYSKRKKEPIVFDNSFKGKELTQQPETVAEMTRLQHFKLFWMAKSLNILLTTQSGKSIKTNAKEIEAFFGIQMTLAIVKMSKYKMYWSPEFRYYELPWLRNCNGMKH